VTPTAMQATTVAVAIAQTILRETASADVESPVIAALRPAAREPMKAGPTRESSNSEASLFRCGTS
jgi:hypothetical protein